MLWKRFRVTFCLQPNLRGFTCVFKRNVSQKYFLHITCPVVFVYCGGLPRCKCLVLYPTAVVYRVGVPNVVTLSICVFLMQMLKSNYESSTCNLTVAVSRRRRKRDSCAYSLGSDCCASGLLYAPLPEVAKCSRLQRH